MEQTKSIQLSIVQTTSTGSLHVQLLIDDEDCGILYLTQDEYDHLDLVIRRGTSNV